MDDNTNYDQMLENIEKNLSKRKIKLLRGNDPSFKLNRISSGIPEYDAILGGGFTRKGLHMLTGDSKSGKTTVALKFIASAQRQKLSTVYFDIESRLDQEWFEKCGVDLSRLLIPPQMDADMVLDAIVGLLDDKVDVIVVDSFASLAPKQITDKDVNEQQPIAALARLLDKAIGHYFLRHNENTVILGINQLRDDVSMKSGRGVRMIMPGGKAQYYNAHTISEVWVKGGLKEGKTQTGHFIQITLRESLHSMPKQFCEFPLSYITGDLGIDIPYWAVDSAVTLEIIERKGPYYYYNGDRFLGQTKVVEYLKENPEQYELLKKQIFIAQGEKPLQQKGDKNKEEVNDLLETVQTELDEARQ